MTTVTNPTFDGPNEGAGTGYDAGALIESDPIDADFTAIETDLLYHKEHLQDIWYKVDLIWLHANYLNLTADEMITRLNDDGTTTIDFDVLNVQSNIDSSIVTAITAHEDATYPTSAHLMTTIHYTNLTFSNTPGSLNSDPHTLYDEMMNVRVMFDKIIGTTYWTDTPIKTIAEIAALFDGAGTALPRNHADEHITGGSDIIHEAISGGASGLMTGADKARIDGMEDLATQDQSAAEIAVLVDAESGINFLSDALLTKLGGIEGEATKDQDASEIRQLIIDATDSNVFTDNLKTKLDNVAVNANLYVHPTGDGNLHVPANGMGQNGEVLTSGAAGIYTWEPKPTTVIMNITEVSTSYNVLSTDYTIMATASSVNLSMNLPPAWIATGQIFQIKKMDSTEYAIVVHGAAGATIDGEITYDLLIQYEAVTVQSTGLNWIVL